MEGYIKIDSSIMESDSYQTKRFRILIELAFSCGEWTGLIDSLAEKLSMNIQDLTQELNFMNKDGLIDLEFPYDGVIGIFIKREKYDFLYSLRLSCLVI